MDHKKNLKKTYNKIAKDWQKDHKEDSWWKEGVDKFIDLLGNGKTVLDIGCASGIKAEYLEKHGLEVTGIDISDKFIEIAKRNFPEAKFLVMDMENITLREKFDGIFAQACLLHAKKKDAPGIIKDWIGLLEIGGYLYLAVKEKGDKDEEVVKEDDYGYEYERFFSYYTKDEIEKYLEDAGLEIIYSDLISSGKRNWVQAIGRKR